MSLQGTYFAFSNPKEYIKLYAVGFFLLIVFMFLFDDWLMALLYYLAVLILCIPFAILYDRNIKKRLQLQQEEMIASEEVQKQIQTKKNIENNLDKSSCMSCLAPVDENDVHCQKCGYKLKI